MFQQHAVHHVLVDVDPEGLRDDARDAWTAEPRIARLELDDQMDECFVWSFWTGLLGARLGGEQPAVFATHQRLMKREERRGAEGDGGFSKPAWPEEQRPESTEQPVAHREVGRPLASAAQD